MLAHCLGLRGGVWYVSVPQGHLLQFFQAWFTNTTVCSEGAGVDAVLASFGMTTSHFSQSKSVTSC